jgi:hypothetical protein
MNETLWLYREVIKATAEKRTMYFADTWEIYFSKPGFGVPPGGHFATENGMHLNEIGYQISAVLLLHTLGFSGRLIQPEDMEPLRQAVIAKNELFFHRWRPENETYLFGFRKHEQGKNAKEVAEFDPLVTRAEEEIEKIRKTLTK